MGIRDNFELERHLYNDNVDAAIKYVKSLDSEEQLYIYAYNYNWDDGFEVPEEILNNEHCTMSVALLIFDLADGMTYLQNKTDAPDLPEWSSFICKLYNRVMEHGFRNGKAAFKPDLSKVQIYKMKKMITEEEQVFISEIEGEDYNIAL